MLASILRGTQPANIAINPGAFSSRPTAALVDGARQAVLNAARSEVGQATAAELAQIASVRIRTFAAQGGAAGARTPFSAGTAAQWRDLADWIARGFMPSTLATGSSVASPRPRPRGGLVGGPSWGGFNTAASAWYPPAPLSPDDKSMARSVTRVMGAEATGDFEPNAWRTLTPALRFLAVRRLIDGIVRAMGIPDDRAPAVGELTDPDLAGETRWSLGDHAGAIDINIANNEAGEIVATIVHECRHYFQMWNGYQNINLGVDFDQLHPSTSVWSTNNNAFVPDSYNEDTNDPDYFIQPVEIDAENFARFVLDWLLRNFP